MTVKPQHADTMLEALHTSGPDPDKASELSLFGQFVGSWTAELINYGIDGQRDIVPAEWHFGWTLQGRAVQDVFFAPRTGHSHTGSYREYGTTVRFYDAALDAWRITWNGPVRGRQILFIGRPLGEEILLEGTEGGTKLQWIFSEVRGDSFHWRALELVDAGKSWHLAQEMSVARVQ